MVCKISFILFFAISNTPSRINLDANKILDIDYRRLFWTPLVGILIMHFRSVGEQPRKNDLYFYDSLCFKKRFEINFHEFIINNISLFGLFPRIMSVSYIA